MLSVHMKRTEVSKWFSLSCFFLQKALLARHMYFSSLSNIFLLYRFLMILLKILSSKVITWKMLCNKFKMLCIWLRWCLKFIFTSKILWFCLCIFLCFFTFVLILLFPLSWNSNLQTGKYNVRESPKCVRGVKGLLGLSSLGLISRLLRG